MRTCDTKHLHHHMAISIALQILRNMVIQVTRSYTGDVCVSNIVLRVYWQPKEGSLLSQFKVGMYLILTLVLTD